MDGISAVSVVLPSNSHISGPLEPRFGHNLTTSARGASLPSNSPPPSPQPPLGPSAALSPLQPPLLLPGSGEQHPGPLETPAERGEVAAAASGTACGGPSSSGWAREVCVFPGTAPRLLALHPPSRMCPEHCRSTRNAPHPLSQMWGFGVCFVCFTLRGQDEVCA